MTTHHDDNAIMWNREALPPGPEQDAVVRGITGVLAEKDLWLPAWINWSTGGGRGACGRCPSVWRAVRWK